MITALETLAVPVPAIHTLYLMLEKDMFTNEVDFP